MLTEAEKKWLEERKKRPLKFCHYCSLRNIDYHSCGEFWDNHGCCPVRTKKDWKDAAEFEARVAAKLAQSPCWSCPEKSKLSCPRGKSDANGRPKAEACRLKHVRLAVEQEMDV